MIVDIIVLLIFQTFAESNIHPTKILLSSRTIDTHDSWIGRRLSNDIQPFQNLDELVKYPFLIQFKKSPKKSVVHDIEEIINHTLDKYIPENSFLISTYPKNVQKILLFEEITHIELYISSDKMRNNMRENINKRRLNQLENLTSSTPISSIFESEENRDQSNIGLNADVTVESLWVITTTKTTSECEEIAISLRKELKSRKWPPSVSVISSDKLLVIPDVSNYTGNNISQEILALLDILSSNVHVLWVEKTPQFRIQRASARMWHEGAEWSPDPIYADGDDILTVFEKHGLNGKGEVIGIGDSGVDWDHCDIQDENIPVTFVDGEPATTINAEDSFNFGKHRKLVAYWNLADSHDFDENGHGTHVVGTVVGQHRWAEPNTTYAGKDRGLAYGGKVFFTDLVCSRGDTTMEWQGANVAACTCTSSKIEACATGPTRRLPQSNDHVYSPPDLYAYYFPVGRAYGAKIHTDSWAHGSEGYYYRTESEVDRFLFERFDHISIFPAGNEGDRGWRSIASPSAAKNVITVGAIGPALGGFVTAELEGDSLLKTIPQILSWAFLHEKCENLYLRCTVQSNDTVCTDLTTSCGRVLYVASNLHLEGHDQVKKGSVSCCDIAKMGNMALWEGSDVDNVYHGCCQETHETFTTTSNWFKQWLELKVAAFSSRGPTYDHRLKPDVVAIGAPLTSSRSGKPACNLSQDDLAKDRRVQLYGTSFAAPVVAGIVAIIRQYFREGYYPSGSKTDFGFDPSGFLVKSVLINGAQPLQRRGGSILTNEQHSFLQGFGAVRLVKSLYLKDEPNSDKLYIDDALVGVGSNEFCRYEFVVDEDFTTDDSESFEIAVTLAWYDWPSVPPAAVTLVNDLDLKMKISVPAVFDDNGVEISPPTQKEILGNNWLQRAGERDGQNTVEKIVATVESRNAKVSVIVKGFSVPVGPFSDTGLPLQKYALSLTGSLKLVNRVCDIDVISSLAELHARRQELEYSTTTQACRFFSVTPRCTTACQEEICKTVEVLNEIRDHPESSTQDKEIAELTRDTILGRVLSICPMSDNLEVEAFLTGACFSNFGTSCRYAFAEKAKFVLNNCMDADHQVATCPSTVHDECVSALCTLSETLPFECQARRVFSRYIDATDLTMREFLETFRDSSLCNVYCGEAYPTTFSTILGTGTPHPDLWYWTVWLIVSFGFLVLSIVVCALYQYRKRNLLQQLRKIESEVTAAMALLTDHQIKKQPLEDSFVPVISSNAITNQHS
eukprot:GHVL01022766.1.p1 GENE.GHVL01022766.1~~GHVL01022766.1.p1  ORF type:complete len:1243 (+),score=208.00 GHVL01022766.1:38-3766(+)